MQVAIPHSLGREEVRRRLQGGGSQIENAIPGGMAKITTEWVDQDTLALNINAMGQLLAGRIAIEDAQVLFDVDLPLALGFIRPMVEGAIKQAGHKLLAPPAA
jgi:Putative polyhydroxyalkanoic acid system protein (PHA_gran_rgn)